MIQDAKLQGTYRLPSNAADDLEELREFADRFKAQEVSEMEFKAFRVPRGVYEQRESGAYMLRIRVPAGAVLPDQLRRAAEVASEYGDGVLHVTTRQDIQVHRVGLDDIYPALARLLEVGLSTKGGGGNTVRNITGCFDAGVCPDEVFDISPYPIGLTEFLIPQESSYELPRKYKIAFSGCGKDCSGATLHDVGFIAKRRNGEDGFAAYVAGGMGSGSRVADLLEEFVPVAEIHLVAEAVKRVFDKHGNRKNKHKARLRFLVKKLGNEEFRRLYESELAELHKNPPPVPEYRPIQQLQPKAETAVETKAPADEFNTWRQLCVVPQKQKEQSGFYMVLVPLLLGDISCETAMKLADIIENHGERMLRTTNRQDAVIRWVHESELADVYEALVSAGLTDLRHPVCRNIVSCTGASTCRLGICLSRGLTRAIAEKIDKSDTAIDGAARVDINISGCPNSCGRHQSAHIGLFGAARRIDGRVMPHYGIQLGGLVEEGKTRLAAGKDVIPAKNVPSLLADLLEAFKGSDQYPDFNAFVDADGRKLAAELAAKYKSAPKFEEDKSYYYDWDADELFSLAGRGAGECSVGMYDLIGTDMASAAEALEQQKYFAATALTCRALLITRAVMPKSDAEAFTLFREHLIEKNFIDKAFEPMILQAVVSAAAAEPERSFSADADQVAGLISAAKKMLDEMGPSLRSTASEPSSPIAKAGSAADRELDSRGVACPVNYVKTKIALDQIEIGQTLSVLLDGEGVRSVPASAEADGHKVIEQKQEGDYWRVVIRKRNG